MTVSPYSYYDGRIYSINLVSVCMSVPQFVITMYWQFDAANVRLLLSSLLSDGQYSYYFVPGRCAKHWIRMSMSVCLFICPLP